MQQSEQINELATALALAQGAFTNPPRNREVEVTMKDNKGKYKFCYSTLDCVMDMIRKPLADNGLSIIHALDNDSQGPICETRLLHASGQWISTWVPVIVSEGANAQGWGSSISYARRYGVVSLLAIAAEEDDDGNAGCANEAQGNARATAAPRKATPGNGKKSATPPATAAPPTATKPPSQEEAALKAVAEAATIPRALEIETNAKERIKDKAVLGRVLARIGNRIAYLLGEFAKTETDVTQLTSWMNFIPTCELLTPAQQETAMQALLAREQELSDKFEEQAAPA